jgi:hypothetical protein
MDIKEECLSLSEQLDKLPESELVRKVRQDFFRTGTCRLEDLYRVLGDVSRTVQVAVQEDSRPVSNIVLGRGV